MFFLTVPVLTIFHYRERWCNIQFKEMVHTKFLMTIYGQHQALNPAIELYNVNLRRIK